MERTQAAASPASVLRGFVNISDSVTGRGERARVSEAAVQELRAVGHRVPVHWLPERKAPGPLLEMKDVILWRYYSTQLFLLFDMSCSGVSQLESPTPVLSVLWSHHVTVLH